MNKKIILIILAIVIFTSLFLIISVEEKEKEELLILNEASVLIKEVSINILSLRRNEKDFLKRKETKYIKKFENNFKLLKQNIDTLADDLQRENIDTRLLLKFSSTINSYDIYFKKIIIQYKKLGLSFNEGHYKKLKTSKENLAKIFKNDKSLFVRIQELEKNEKDFLLRNDSQYVKDFLTIFEKKYIETTNIESRQALISYKKNFLDLVEIKKTIGLDENSGLVGKMRVAVHISEDILEVLSKQIEKDIKTQFNNLTKVTEVFILLIFLVVTFIIILLVKFLLSESKVNNLTSLNDELSQTLSELEKTQDKLIESEKMASLGGLVAGVAHEINTPLGIALTGITYFDDITEKINKAYESDNMSQEDFEKYLASSKEISAQILLNIKRASDLVHSFKQVSVDQTHEEKREFYIKDYTDGIILSVTSQLKKANVQISNNIPSDVKIYSYPGAYGQIITNLILNSLIHGYSGLNKGKIEIKLRNENDKLIFNYIDDGNGISEENLSHIFDPFFTTRRGSGGTGLGLHIIYNIIRKKFNGHIKCTSQENKGVNFEIDFPLNTEV